MKLMQAIILIAALLLFLMLGAAFAAPATVTWVPAMTDADGKPLPGDQLTQIRTTDCKDRVYRGWGRYSSKITSVKVELPELLPCECVQARTVVPSWPADRQASDWVQAEKCQQATCGDCHA